MIIIFNFQPTRVYNGSLRKKDRTAKAKGLSTGMAHFSSRYPNRSIYINVTEKALRFFLFAYECHLLFLLLYLIGSLFPNTAEGVHSASVSFEQVSATVHISIGHIAIQVRQCTTFALYLIRYGFFGQLDFSDLLIRKSF